MTQPGAGRGLTPGVCGDHRILTTVAPRSQPPRPPGRTPDDRRPGPDPSARHVTPPAWADSALPIRSRRSVCRVRRGVPPGPRRSAVGGRTGRAAAIRSTCPASVSRSGSTGHARDLHVAASRCRRSLPTAGSATTTPAAWARCAVRRVSSGSGHRIAPRGDAQAASRSAPSAPSAPSALSAARTGTSGTSARSQPCTRRAAARSSPAEPLPLSRLMRSTAGRPHSASGTARSIAAAARQVSATASNSSALSGCSEGRSVRSILVKNGAFACPGNGAVRSAPIGKKV